MAEQQETRPGMPPRLLHTHSSASSASQPLTPELTELTESNVGKVESDKEEIDVYPPQRWYYNHDHNDPLNFGYMFPVQPEPPLTSHVQLPGDPKEVVAEAIPKHDSSQELPYREGSQPSSPQPAHGRASPVHDTPRRARSVTATFQFA